MLQEGRNSRRVFRHERGARGGPAGDVAKIFGVRNGMARADWPNRPLRMGAGCARQPRLARRRRFTHLGFKYLANNVEADGEDIVTAPLHLDAAGAMLTNPRFYLVVGGAGAAFGGSFALDQTMRSHLHDMSSSTASMLQNISYGSVGAATALLYGYGLYAGDARARQYALTAGEGAGIATLVNVGIKAAFGRLRPSPGPPRPRRLLPRRTVVRLGRRDADVRAGVRRERVLRQPLVRCNSGVFARPARRLRPHGPRCALVLRRGRRGAAWRRYHQLFLYLHRQHEEHPWRFRTSPVAPPTPAGHAGQSLAPAGLMVAFSW